VGVSTKSLKLGDVRGVPLVLSDPRSPINRVAENRSFGLLLRIIGKIASQLTADQFSEFLVVYDQVKTLRWQDLKRANIPSGRDSIHSIPCHFEKNRVSIVKNVTKLAVNKLSGLNRKRTVVPS
jgi:hypothetical protein